MGRRACSLLTTVSPGGRYGLGHPCTLTLCLLNPRPKGSREKITHGFIVALGLMV
jgi:hypothetical protein